MMLSFFGIPPYSEDRLNDNILKKRRSWYAKTSANNAVGRERATRVVELIERVTEALKRGATVDLDGGAAAEEIPEEIFNTLEDLWRLVSEYVFADDYERALRVSRRAAAMWGPGSGSASVLAWVVATGFDSGALVNPAVLAEGLAAAADAVQAAPLEARNWESQVSLLLAAGRAEDALVAADRATAALPARTARLEIMRAAGLLGVSRIDDAALAAVRAVHQAGADPNTASVIRSQATRLLVDWLATNLLPIKSRPGLAQYVELVQVAAWCSNGVPEAEDLVRVHRLWATNAGQRVFVGSWKLRSFLAVCTGFVSLPVHNYLRSQPAWRVFLTGLDGGGSEAFWIVASPQYVQDAHHMKIVTHLDQL